MGRMKDLMTEIDDRMEDDFECWAYSYEQMAQELANDPEYPNWCEYLNVNRSEANGIDH